MGLLLVGCATSGASEGGLSFDALDSSVSEPDDDERDGSEAINDGDDVQEETHADGVSEDGEPAGDGDGAVVGDGDGAPTDGTPGDGDGDGTPTDGTPGDGDGEPDPPVQTCANTVPAQGTNPLLDDMNDNNQNIVRTDGRNGTWYVSDDATAAPLAPSANGVLGMTKLAEGNYAATVSGGPYASWGASVGFDLRTAGGEVCGYDLTNYSGVRFRAKGNGNVTFKVRTRTTAADPDNYDGHGATVVVNSSFQTFTMCFSQLRQNYGTITTFEHDAVMNMHWQLDPNVSVQLTVDDVNLVSGSCTQGVQ